MILKLCCWDIIFTIVYIIKKKKTKILHFFIVLESVGIILNFWYECWKSVGRKVEFWWECCWNSVGRILNFDDSVGRLLNFDDSFCWKVLEKNINFWYECCCWKGHKIVNTFQILPLHPENWSKVCFFNKKILSQWHV